jgi:ElaB/YqjD/DUF883 family membrane-anchored ribosome-binding protein
MNDICQPNGSTNMTSSAADRAMPVADTSMLPGSAQAPAKAVNTLNRAVQGAHNALDRFADSAEPTVRQLGESASNAGTSLRVTAEQLDQTRMAWTDNVRSTVRTHPLAAVAAGLAIGALLMRMKR